MTKSTITRERIQRIIRAIDSESYDEEEIREWLTSDEIMGLARMALAAMDSEPVVWIAQNKNTGEVEIDEPFAKATNPKYWTDSFPVYRHAQQQVVPDELKEAAAYFLTVLDEYPKQLVPINRDSAVVRALRAAMKEVK